MKRKKGRMVYKLCAWLLSAVMIFPALNVPVKAAEEQTGFGTERDYSDNVAVTVNAQGTPSNDWSGFELSLTNNTGESICDWLIEMTVPSGSASAFKCWNATFEASGDTIYLYPNTSNSNAVLAPGNMTANPPGFGFSSRQVAPSDITIVKVSYNKGTQSRFDYSSGNTNDDSTSGGGSGGEQGDTTKDLNLDVEYNFAKLLQYSLYFYDANMCGELEGKCAVDWRKNCHLNDKTAVKYNGKTIDVSGGFHDAGDHDKFGLPQGYTATMLGIGYYEFKDAYEKTGQSSHFKTILDYFCDYFVRCTVLDAAGNAEAFCYQVGDGASHNQWVSAENENIARPAYFADSSNPATDQVSEAATALAIHSMNFGDETYLDYAKKLFAMAKKNGKAAKNSDGGDYYKSSSWADDYCLAAAWLYKATGEESYLAEFQANKGSIPTGAWASWDQVGPYALAYGTGDFSPLADNATGMIQASKTISNGYTWLCMWGSARYNCNMQLEGLIFDKHANKDWYTSWANGQMKFLLGNSVDKRCYVVGYNKNSSRYPHHRSSSGYADFPDSGYQTTVQAHMLTGALVGGIEGVDSSNGSIYHDSSADYYCNEVAIDYNAAFTGAAAALYLLNENDEDQMLDSNYTVDSTATCPANKGGIAANGSEEITVNKAEPTVSVPERADVEAGTKLSEIITEDFLKNCSASVDGSFAWEEEDQVLTYANHNAKYHLVFTPNETDSYTVVKKPITLTVTRKVNSNKPSDASEDDTDDGNASGTGSKDEGDGADSGSITGSGNTADSENASGDKNNGNTATGNVSDAGEKEQITASAMILTANVKGVSNMAVKGTMKMAPKKTMVLKVAFAPEDAEPEAVTFQSSNSKIAAVNADGKITAKKTGKTTITVTSKNGLKKSFKLQVMKKAVSKVQIKAARTTIKVKKTVKLKAATAPGRKLASAAVVWKSSNPKTATVSSSGKVKGLKKGKVKITAVATDGSGKKATITLRVR